MRAVNYLIIALSLLVIFVVAFKLLSTSTFKKINILRVKNEEYNPAIYPNDFVPQVDNIYFKLVPGSMFIYEKKTDEGMERVEVEVTGQTKTVLGISTTVVLDKVYLNDELVEETYDWYAQDRNGNVWYFGEDVNNYENGNLKDHAGAWEAGVNGALPGIIMKANPAVGDSYRQEYSKNKAEDMGEIVALDQNINTSHQSFSGCLKTHDTSKIDSSANEYKYYCPEVGFVVLEERVNDNEKLELVSIL